MLKIVTGANTPILRKICQPVTEFDTKLTDILEEMEDCMLGGKESNVIGIGLAANQVGLDMRAMLVTFNIENKKNRKIIAMVNPEILETSNHEVKMEEGCLSLPETFGTVKRPSKIKARWQNKKGNWCEKKLSGWDARIFQHELDHLNGKLFTDYLPKGTSAK